MRRGVGVRLDGGAEASEQLRGALHRRWEGLLSSQDKAAAWAPHWTVMNKVDDETKVEKALANIRKGLCGVAHLGMAVGVKMWRYEGGAWVGVREWAFTGEGWRGVLMKVGRKVMGAEKELRAGGDRRRGEMGGERGGNDEKQSLERSREIRRHVLRSARRFGDTGSIKRIAWRHGLRLERSTGDTSSSSRKVLETRAPSWKILWRHELQFENHLRSTELGDTGSAMRNVLETRAPFENQFGDTSSG